MLSNFGTHLNKKLNRSNNNIKWNTKWFTMIFLCFKIHSMNFHEGEKSTESSGELEIYSLVSQDLLTLFQFWKKMNLSFIFILYSNHQNIFHHSNSFFIISIHFHLLYHCDEDKCYSVFFSLYQLWFSKMKTKYNVGQE